MDEIEFISHLKGLNLDQNISKLEKKIKNDMAELINVTNQIKIENFLSGDLSDLLIVNYIDVINFIKSKPTRIHSNFTGMISGIILDWIMSILQNPEAFARIVVKYFRNNNKNLNYFSAITFPCLFHHFFTEDFQKLSYRFLLSMLESGDIGTFWYFCLSFVESSSNFSTVLWTNFLNLNENQNIFFINNRISQQNSDQLNYQPQIQRSQIFFHFLKCLKAASTALSIYQQQIVKKFFEAHAPTCSFFLCKYFIERSFFWFRGNEPDQKNQLSSYVHSGSSSDRSGNNPFLSGESLSLSSKNESESTYDESFYIKSSILSRKNATYIRFLNEEIIKILEYAALNPKSPQFTTIVKVLTTNNYSRFVPNIVGTHTNFILSQRDCFLIQEIIRQSVIDSEEESKKNNEADNSFSGKNEKELSLNNNNSDISFVKVFPLTKESFNNFAPMSIEIPLVSFFKVYKDEKVNNFNSFDSNSNDLSLFEIKNDKFQKLLDLAMFDRFIENEYSKRKFEQTRSHFCFASKLLQKNQFVKRKMIDFNSFYGYFQNPNYKLKRHTHSDQTVFNENNDKKNKKGITSHKSYYNSKTSNLFDLPPLTLPPLSPEPKTSRCPISSTPRFSTFKEANSSDSAHSYQGKKTKRKVVFNTNEDNDNQNKQIALASVSDQRRLKSLSQSKPNINCSSDFGYNNEEYVVILESKNKKRTSFHFENSYQTAVNINREINKNNNDVTNNDNQNNNDNNQNNDNEKLTKKEKKKLKKERKKEKKQTKKEKSDKNKDEEKEEKKEEKNLLKEMEQKEKKEKKENLKIKKEEEKMMKIRKKREKRREKMRKNQDKKGRRNSEISISGSADDEDTNNNETDSAESSINQAENKIISKADNNDINEDTSNIYSSHSNLSDKEISVHSPRHFNSSAEENDNSENVETNSDENNINDLDPKSIKKVKNSKFKSKDYADENVDSYVSCSIFLTACDAQKKVQPLLNNLIPQIENNESQLILYCIKLNDFEFKSKKVDQITIRYIQLMNSIRIRKIKKYITLHSNWIGAASILANEIDFMSDFNIGTSILIFCQICKFFSPLSAYGQSTISDLVQPLYSTSNVLADHNISFNQSSSKIKLKNQDIQRKEKDQNQKNIIFSQNIQNNINEQKESLSENEIEEEESDEQSDSIKKTKKNERNHHKNSSDTDSSLNLYSYSAYNGGNGDVSDKSGSDINSDSELSNSYNLIKDNYLEKSNDDQISVFPTNLINKDVVKFLKFVLMLSNTDSFIQYFTWISRVLVVFPQIKKLLGQIYGIDVSHLEMAFKILLSKTDMPLLIKIRDEVFKEARKTEK